MTAIHKLEGFVILGALLLGLVFGVGALREHARALRAEAIAQERQQQIDARDTNIRTRDQADKFYGQKLKQEAAAVKTPQQAARVIVRYLPQAAPAGSAETVQLAAAPVTVDREQLSPALRQQLPESPSYTLFTAPQTEQIAKDELACDATSHAYETCREDRKDLKDSLADQKAIADAWKAAARGGTKWARFRHAAKLAGCAAIGAGTASALDAKPRVASAAGAGAVALCSLF